VAVQLPTRLSRRRLFAASGATLAAGSAAALAACGTTEDENESTSPAREAELLNEVLAQQLAVIEVARFAAKGAPEEAAAAAAELRELRVASTDALEGAIAELDGTPAGEAAASVEAESAVEGLARQLEAAIAASVDAIGEINPERRQPVQRAITEDAAALAVMRSTLGEEVAPDAFVMGPAAAQEQVAE